MKDEYMETDQKWVLLIDDDATFVCATADLIDEACKELGVSLRICTSTHEMPAMYKELLKADVRLAILDLWLLDKQTNEPQQDGGMKILRELRQHWPDCYVIVHSAHLTAEAEAQLKRYINISIVKKPAPTFVITDIMKQIVEASAEAAITV